MPIATAPLPAASDTLDALLRGCPAYKPTPLLNLPRLAAALGVVSVLAKDEGHRMLGSFKALGGTYAGLRALARAGRTSIDTLIATRPGGQPALVCASDGNHGLAIAAAARLAGARACVFLHGGVPQDRAHRIEAQGAELVWVRGTYDDAVDAAAAAARAGSGILVADTTDDPDDPIVWDVMAGYGVMAAEIRDQVAEAGHARPTHLFVQAGVGGLAAAMAEGLGDWLAAPGTITVVEPESAPAVTAALAAGRPVRVAGDLETTAEMLSCGEASAPAMEVLCRYGVGALTVSENALVEARTLLHDYGGPLTTTSGSAGLAGAFTAARHQFDAGACILILITESAAGSAG